ncbi:septum site-determining protein MinD [Spirulina sp. CS-785/01]|uniref:septum site-determining protein MinD n=1 Tax=Spirulina sp. CS-785/01 TaxID=3021716 RepID=UPI0023313D1F|nr:septum site-determining protein MinD [Spirulina sp. CS-785/01]MDB9311468.1 septum site-determining protein MinD [Spirulina sp. CS-785/01]
MTRIIVITSGKGGVGKTTITANLGTAIAKRGHKTVLIDADFGLRNLDLLLGLENRVVYTAMDAISGQCRLEQALIKDKRQPNLVLLPAAQNRNKESINPEQMKKLVAALGKVFDYIIVDCPAGIEGGFRNAIAAAREAIIVTTPEVAAVRDADRVIGLLEANDIRRIHLVVNRIRPEMVQISDMMSVEDVLEILAIPLIGIVPDDERIIIASNRGEPIVLEKNPPLSGVAIKNIASRLDGEKVPFLDILAIHNNWFNRLRRWLGI